jgi:Cof subfamily protein (haloacid dehalogenase superfamily)
VPVRLVATDVDGTLLRSDQTVSPRVAKALQGAEDAGIRVVLLTARRARSFLSVIGDTVSHGVAVCSNGAIVYDLATRTTLRSHPFAASELRAFLDRAVAHDAAYAWETPDEGFRTGRYHEIATAQEGPPPEFLGLIEIVDDIADHHVVTKVLLRHPTLNPQELYERLLPIAAPINVVISGGPFVEAMAPGVTKAFALEQLCAEYGVAAQDVVAVGDHTNDLPMLRWAGRGVAMGNAHPSVLAEIADVTASNDEDGLALVVESLL